MPKLVLTQEDDSASPMTVSPTSVHRADSMSPSVDSLGRISDNSHRKYATVSNDEIPARNRHQSEARPPASTANPQRSRANSTVESNGEPIIPITESPTQSITSRRSGSIASGESVQFQSLQQLVDSPPPIRQRVVSVDASAIPEPDTGSPGKKRRTTGRQHASSVGAASYTKSKPPTRHQTTMGMGLASALAASGMGIAPPPNMLVSHTGSLAPPTLNKKASNVSISNLPNGRVSPERTRVVRSRDRSNSSRPANDDSGDDSDDYDSEDALSFNDDEIPITGFAVATMKRNQDFHELFPQVPTDDYLIDGM